MRLNTVVMDVSGVKVLSPTEEFRLNYLDDDQAVISEMMGRQVIFKQISKDNILAQIEACKRCDEADQERMKEQQEELTEELKGNDWKLLLESILDNLCEHGNGEDEIWQARAKAFRLRDILNDKPYTENGDY